MFAQKQNENRPLQYFFSQRSNPLDPDEDGLKSDKKSSSNEPKFHYLPSFPLTVEDFMKDSKSNSLKNSSQILEGFYCQIHIQKKILKETL